MIRSGLRRRADRGDNCSDVSSRRVGFGTNTSQPTRWIPHGVCACSAARGTRVAVATVRAEFEAPRPPAAPSPLPARSSAERRQNAAAHAANIADAASSTICHSGETSDAGDMRIALIAEPPAFGRCRRGTVNVPASRSSPLSPVIENTSPQVAARLQISRKTSGRGARSRPFRVHRLGPHRRSSPRCRRWSSARWLRAIENRITSRSPRRTPTSSTSSSARTVARPDRRCFAGPCVLARLHGRCERRQQRDEIRDCAYVET